MDALGFQRVDGKRVPVVYEYMSLRVEAGRASALRRGNGGGFRARPRARPE